MRRLLLALVPALLVAGPLGAQAAPPAIFREISIAPLGRIALGEPFEQHEQLAAAIGEGLYQLPAGFGDTKAILVQVDSSARVTALYFVYVDGKDFEAARASYVENLGTPIGTEETDTAGVRLRRAVWRDARTHFELLRRQHPDSLPEVFALLRDR